MRLGGRLIELLASTIDSVLSSVLDFLSVRVNVSGAGGAIAVVGFAAAKKIVGEIVDVLADIFADSLRLSAEWMRSGKDWVTLISLKMFFVSSAACSPA